MKEILLGYLLIQLWTNSIGLIVINKCSPLIDKEFKKKGYVKVDKGSMYNTSEVLKNFVRLFIPFYFCVKGLKLVDASGITKDAMKAKLKNGEYVKASILKEEAKEASDEYKDSTRFIGDSSLFIPKKEYISEKYQASTKIPSIYSSNIEIHPDVEEIVIHNDEVKLTPFEIQPERVKSEKEDLIEYVLGLNDYNLDNLKNSLDRLINKRKKELKLSKDKKTA